MVMWEDKCHHYKHPSPSFKCTVQHHVARNVSLFSWSQLSWLCLLPYSLCTPSLITGAVGWNRKGLEAMQALLAVTENIPVLSALFHADLQIQNTIPYELLWRKQQQQKVCKWHQQEALGDIQIFTVFESWFYRKQVSYFQYCVTALCDHKDFILRLCSPFSQLLQYTSLSYISLTACATRRLCCWGLSRGPVALFQAEIWERGDRTA